VVEVDVEGVFLVILSGLVEVMLSGEILCLLRVDKGPEGDLFRYSSSSTRNLVLCPFVP
jgi:hypothetical protein